MSQSRSPAKASANPALTERLKELIRRYGVPGASLAVFSDGRLEEAAAGVLNLETQVPVTPEALFQVGSITKLYTATLAMQLVEEGRLSLDLPVRTYLPDFKVKDEETSAHVTLRHLLSHTSGIEGDLFKNAGRGEDRIEKFVALLATQENVHPLGEMFSYSNVGFVIAGRMIEAASGLYWDKAMRTRLIKPLGTPAFSTLPEQAMRYLTAIGHIGSPEKGLAVTPVAFLAQSNGPAGATPMARARDVIEFARLHMPHHKPGETAPGTAANGTRILSEESALAMRAENIRLPAGMEIDAIGLGFMMWRGANGTYEIFGHDGSTIGQAAWLRFHPASGTAIVLLTNGGDGKGLYHELFPALFQELAGVKLPEKDLGPVPEKIDAARFEGTYACGLGEMKVRAEKGGLICKRVPSADYALVQPPLDIPLEAAGPDFFFGRDPGRTLAAGYHFLGEDGSGRAQYLHTGVRAYRRTL